MEAVSLGALFLLALLGPAFVAGATDLANVKDKDPWVIIIGVIGAAGVGALLQLTGRALWEFVLPLSPQGGWRGISKRRFTRKNDFRAAIARSDAQKEYWVLAGPATGPFADDNGNPPIPRDAPWSYGHRVVITAEYYLYRDAPDGVLQWIRRRYLRFVDAVSAAVAICLGLGIGWLLPGQDLATKATLDSVLVIIAAGTFAFANESRREAQQMETFWYRVRDHDKEKHQEPVTHLAFEPTSELVVRPILRKPSPPEVDARA